MYFEQFYHFPLRKNFLGEAGEPAGASCPVPSPDCAAASRLALPPPPLSARKAGRPVRPTFTEGPGSCWALAQPGGGEGGEDTVSTLSLADCGTGGQSCPKRGRGQGCARKESSMLSRRARGGESSGPKNKRPGREAAYIYLRSF